MGAVLEVVFSVPLEEVRSYALGGEYIVAGGAHFHKNWLLSWDLAKRKIVLKEGWKFNEIKDRDTVTILWFRNVEVFLNENAGSFMDVQLVESIRDCRNNKVLYPQKTAS